MNTEKKKKFRIRSKAPEGFFTVRQAAEYLNVSTKTIRRYIKDHGLPATKPAGVYLISRADLERWVKENG